MNIWINRIIFILFLFFLLVSYVYSGEKEETIFKKMEKAIYPENISYTAKVTIYRPGKKYKKLIKVYIKGYEKSLIEFLEPPQERHTRILMIGDNMWLYLPSVEKVIRLSGRIKMGGGDFIYDDILRAKLTLDYYIKRLIEEKEDYILELKAKNNKVFYDSIKLWVKKETLLPQKAEFYTFTGNLLKTLTYMEPKRFKGRVIPSKLLMQLAMSSDYKTVLEVVDYNDKKIRNRIFTQEYLKKGF